MQVRDHEIDRLAAKQLERLFGGFGGGDLHAQRHEHGPKKGHLVGLVVHEKHPPEHRLRGRPIFRFCHWGELDLSKVRTVC